MADWLTPEQRRRNMAAIRSTGTMPEQLLKLLLRAAAPRRRLVEQPQLPGKPDYYLPGLKLAFFADGCYWHHCPRHGRIPEDNRSYWLPKLASNRARDRAADVALRRQGVLPVRIWEHELRGDMRVARRKITGALNRASRIRVRVGAATKH